MLNIQLDNFLKIKFPEYVQVFVLCVLKVEM